MPGSTVSGALNRAVHHYRKVPLGARLFVHGRAFLSDLAFVEQYVPRHGFIVDVGCGHGLFANVLAEASATRRVLGLDLDERKIKIATATAEGRPALRFEVGDAIATPPPPCDAITIVDVLYLLPFADQERVLRNAAAALLEGKPLIVKAQERALTPRFALTYGQELITVGLGFTRGARSRFYFPTRSDAIAMFERSGFSVDVVEMRRRPYTDVVYLARRRP